MRVIIGTCAAAVAAAVMLSGCGCGCGGGGAQTFTVHGTVRNEASIGADPDGANLPVPVSATQCTDDETVIVLATIGGRSVRIATGRTSTTGRRVADGYYGDCITTFTIPDVPGGYASYGLQVQGQAPPVNMTRAQLAEDVGLTFGG